MLWGNNLLPWEQASFEAVLKTRDLAGYFRNLSTEQEQERLLVMKDYRGNDYNKTGNVHIN